MLDRQPTIITGHFQAIAELPPLFLTVAEAERDIGPRPRRGRAVSSCKTNGGNARPGYVRRGRPGCLVAVEPDLSQCVLPNRNGNHFSANQLPRRHSSSSAHCRVSNGLSYLASTPGGRRTKLPQILAAKLGRALVAHREGDVRCVAIACEQ